MPFDASRQVVRLYHGSPEVVQQPMFGLGSRYNDYGLGFYCTEVHELACEWACPTPRNGVVNAYDIDLSGLALIDLESPAYTTLNWLAILVENRRFAATTPLMAHAKQFLRERYLVDLSAADVVCGYRADDRYFSFARAFLSGTISLAQLEFAMRLGGLGTQVVVRSEAAFGRLGFAGAQLVEGQVWNPRRMKRDEDARRAFDELVRDPAASVDGVYILDLLRSAS